MFRTIVSITMCVGSLLNTANAQISLVCTVERSGGLHFDRQTHQWNAVGFGPGKKFTLRSITKNDAKEFGSQYLPVSETERFKPQYLGADRVFIEENEKLPLAFCWSKNIDSLDEMQALYF